MTKTVKYDKELSAAKSNSELTVFWDTMHTRDHRIAAKILGSIRCTSILLEDTGESHERWNDCCGWLQGPDKLVTLVT